MEEVTNLAIATIIAIGAIIFYGVYLLVLYYGTTQIEFPDPPESNPLDVDLPDVPFKTHDYRRENDSKASKKRRRKRRKAYL